MGTQFVKSITEMKQANRLFYRKIKVTQSRILQRLAMINKSKSRQIAENAKFKGTLISSIDLERASSIKYRVIASAPHAVGIETGQPEERGRLSFDDHPLLESWVRQKLMGLGEEERKKGEFFLKKRWVLVGEKGYPSGYPLGLQFMELGFEHTVGFSNRVVSAELNRLGR